MLILKFNLKLKLILNNKLCDKLPLITTWKSRQMNLKIDFLLENDKNNQ